MKEAYGHYAQELEFQRRRWEEKPSLRKLYHAWYARIVAELSPLRPVVEIGSGSGNFKEYFPEVISTDVHQMGPWIDQIVDARSIPFAEGELGNIVAIDFLHHMPRPISFLQASIRALKVGGRLVLFEPAVTPWSHLVFKLFHHERMDFREDLFALNETAGPANEGFIYSNMAIAHLLFRKNRERLLALLPRVTLLKVEFSDFLVYPATGGFSYLSFLPAGIVPFLYHLESGLLKCLADRWTGMRMLIVLEKKSE